MIPPVRGARVSVPLGKRVVTGIAVGNVEAWDRERAGTEDMLKDVIEVVDDETFLPEAIVELALWVAEYYACGPGDALAAAMPPATASKTIRVATLTAQGHEPELPLKGRQREAIELLKGAPEGLTTVALAARGISPDVLKRLAVKGLLALARDRVERDPFRSGAVSAVTTIATDRLLTDEQRHAVQSLQDMADARSFGVALLQGVTGSGKTEVYLRVAARVLEQGRSVLLLVPEIALTPAVASAFRDTFGDRVAVQHSGLSSGERSDQWRRIRRGEVPVVIGTRSAVFAPLKDLGLIIVDEEHDASYKQDETPRYHGRDVAVMRAKQENALIVLGSATPSLESGHNAASGRYQRIVMQRRVQDRPLAAVAIVDMRQEYAARGPDVILSSCLEAAIDARMNAGQQALVLLNRRGLATAVFCRQCGSTLDCPNCSVSLIIHADGRERHRARCHYCNHSLIVPTACPKCAGPYLERRGFGTERVAAEIAARWPGAVVGRLDRDSVRRKNAAAEILKSMALGTLDILVGTQMIAKGHDFPGVTLVGVISADVGLGVADFRAAERTFQLLTQVAGRAGRGSEPGEAIVQTLYPEHYSILHACRQNYDAFFADELRYRETMRYPPLTALVNVVVRARDARSALTDAGTLVHHLRSRAEAGQFRILGPAPAPVAKLKGEYRVQLFLKGRHRGAMREAVLAAIAAEPDMRRRVAVDIDPVSIL